MNTVNKNNFNQTMDGYVKYALKFMEDRLREPGNVNFTEEQIDIIKRLFGYGMTWAKDELTMEDARKYAER